MLEPLPVGNFQNMLPVKLITGNCYSIPEYGLVGKVVEIYN